MTNLLALAERVEKLTGPDREVDGAICLALGWTLQKMKGDRHPYYRRPGETDYYMRSTPPAYTASIDAARSLGGMVVFASDIGADGLAMVKVVSDTSMPHIDEHTGIASRLEHAWLAASLRALARQREG